MIVSGSSYPLSKLANVLSGNGTSNILPNQTLSGGAASILTQGLADGRYLPANTLSSGSTTVTGNLYVNSGDANFNGRLSLGPTGTAAGHGVYLNVNSGNNDTVANFQSTSGSGNQSRIVFSDNISCRYIGIVGSDFSIWNSSAGVRQFTVTDAGKVGIGTTTPGYALDVAGSINLTGTLYQNGVPFTSGGGSGGNWVATGSDATIVAGNVGIGTVTPQAALDVNGSVKLTGTTTLAGTVRVSGTNSAILINPQGDLLMGEFQSGPQPQ